MSLKQEFLDFATNALMEADDNFLSELAEKTASRMLDNWDSGKIG